MKRILLLSMFLVGCSTTARFYPVEGPIMASGNVRPIVATAHGITGNNGRIELTRQDGSLCEGEWSSAAGSGMSYQTGSLMSTYGSAHLSSVGFSTGHGQNPGRAVILCPDGNVIDMEFTTGAGTANGFGIAKDKKGNVFRVIF